MTVTETTTLGTTKTIRKRKTHNKSRRGCGNCKLRRVKCDEGKPCCKRCLNFGVSCSYDGKTTLESTIEGTFSVDIPINSSLNESILTFITSPQPAQSTSSEESEFDVDDHAALERFRTRTVYSIGTEWSQDVYKRVIPELALEHPFLMHLVITLVLMHDRFLADVKLEEPSPQSESEAYHWYQGTVIFNQKLRQLYSPMTNTERDAMWGAAVSLGCIAFFCIEGDQPQQVWPLKPPGPLDLDWLKISDGKKEVWRVANPLRPESCFAELAKEQWGLLAHPREEPPLPEGFKELWDEEPYQRSAGVVGQVLHVECNRQTVLLFLGFISRMESEFLKALVERDPKAMLLLGVWYAKLCPYRQWWTMRRAVLESQAICIYLEQNHPELVSGVGKHLYEFVRTESGLAKGWGWRDFAREAGFGGVLGKEAMCQWRQNLPVFASEQSAVVGIFLDHMPPASECHS